MALSDQRKGELFSLAEMTLWAPWPVIAVLSYQHIPILLSFAWSVVLATLSLGAWITFRGTWRETLKVRAWKYALVTAVFNSFLFHALYFFALKYTTPGNAALIGLLNALTNFFFFTYVRKEKVRPHYVLGTAFLMFGGTIVLMPNFSGGNIGDLLALAAICCTPIGNLAMQKGREVVSSDSLIFLRNLLTIPLVFAAAAFLGEHASLTDIQEALPFLLFNGVLVLALSKILFVEAIKRVSVPKATALESIAPLITLLAAWLLLGQAPTIWQLASFVPLAIGVLLITDQFPSGKRATMTA